MRCPSCQTYITLQANYCPTCGANLTTAVGSPQAWEPVPTIYKAPVRRPSSPPVHSPPSLNSNGAGFAGLVVFCVVTFLLLMIAISATSRRTISRTPYYNSSQRYGRAYSNGKEVLPGTPEYDAIVRMAAAPKRSPTTTQVLPSPTAIPIPTSTPLPKGFPLETMEPNVSNIANNKWLSACVSANGNLIAGISLDGTIDLWNTSTGRFKGNITTVNGKQNSNSPDAINRKPHPIQFGHLESCACALSPDGSLIATAADNGIVLWDTKTKRLRNDLIGTIHNISALMFSSDSRYLLASGNKIQDDRPRLEVWDVVARKISQFQDLTIRSPLSSPITLAFSPNGKFYAAFSDDGTITLWNFQTRQIWWENRQHGYDRIYFARAISFSADSKHICISEEYITGSKIAAEWDVNTGSKRNVLVTTDLTIIGVAYSHDGKWLAVLQDNPDDGSTSLTMCHLSSGRLYDVDWPFSPWTTAIQHPLESVFMLFCNERADQLPVLV